MNSQCITAQIVHFQNGTVLQASTNEWAIRQHLYKPNDTAAYINLARVNHTISLSFRCIYKYFYKVLAQRCLESGLTEMLCNIKPSPNGKTEKFLKTLENEGVKLQEPEQYKPDRPWNLERPEKPWEVTE